MYTFSCIKFNSLIHAYMYINDVPVVLFLLTSKNHTPLEESHYKVQTKPKLQSL